MQSLNELREWFLTGRGSEEFQGTDICTNVTLTFPNGQSVQADLSIGWFDDEEGPCNHIGMELWVKSPNSTHDEGSGVMLDVMSSWEGAWTLDDVTSVFGIDADAPIWVKESELPDE